MKPLFRNLIFFIFFCNYLKAQNTDLPQILQHDNSVKITELRKLNTDFREVNLSLTPDGNFLFFMSCRGGQTWSYKRLIYNKVQYDGDIYIAEKNDGKWDKFSVLQPPINNAKGQDEPVVSPDGQTVYYQSWRNDWASTGGPYYCSQLHGTEWSVPVGLGGGITQFFVNEQLNNAELATDGMAVSPDGNIFVCAYSNDYDGFMDLYFSTRQQNGQWGEMKKLALSTEKNERSAFFAPDNHSFYFASDGYGGFGGLDIFKTTLNANGTFSEIYNVGKPLNSNEDDFGLVLAANGNEAYFIRHDDIFFADITLADSILKPNNTTLISGTITDSLGNFVEITVKLFEKDDNKIINTSRSNSTTGRFLTLTSLHGNFLLKLYPPKVPPIVHNFTIDNNTPNNLIFNFIVPPTNIPPITQNLIVDTIPIQEECENQNGVKNMKLTVYFDNDRFNISPVYEKMLTDSLLSIKKFTIENILIEGHTDGNASNSYNEKLSRNRSNEVMKWFENKGIATSILQVSAYGETKPIDDNNTETGRQNNRRVEILIVYSE